MSGQIVWKNRRKDKTKKDRRTQENLGSREKQTKNIDVMKK
jgi:hypothetical protein